MSATLDLKTQPWMTDAPTRSVMRALSDNGGDARFVGGAVRNALLGEPIGDIDIATPLVPDEVMRRLTAAGLGAVPTGIEHGTVTAVANGKPFEVTTLRRDVTTDGRRAVVAFTTDWKEDAGRRDFTMNALYTDESGTVYDYFGGVADLRAGRVRFVGDPRTRIREDYLRILRLFRFHAWYGKGEIDRSALAAVVAEKAGLTTLSGERVQKELLRLLEAKNPEPTLRIMNRTGILDVVLPGATLLSSLLRVVQIDEALFLRPDPVFRLARMFHERAAVEKAAETLKLSNKGREHLLDVHDTVIAPDISDGDAHKFLYRLGAQRFKDRVLMGWSSERHEEHEGQRRKLLALADAWTIPRFPLDGGDVKALGIDEGPKVGALLRDIEQWWIDSDFAPGRDALLARLKDVARKHKG